MEIKLIQSDPSIMMGKPVVAGTRITVELLLEKLTVGETVEQLLEAYPCLTIVDLRINDTLQTGAVSNRTYRGAKVSLYFLNSP